MSYTILRVNGAERAADIRALNGLFPQDFEPLKDYHLECGYWWLMYPDDCTKAAGFAGMVEFTPAETVGYIKRTAILPEHRGRGLQKRLIAECEDLAKDLGKWTRLVSSTHISNHASSNSFISAGYKLFEPERLWEGKDSLYWIKRIA